MREGLWRYVRALAGVRALTKEARVPISIALGAFLPLQVVLRLGRAVDVLDPGLRAVSIERPLFVVGHPRSGTTYAHRLLAMDRGRFTTMTTLETLLPSRTLQRAFRSSWRPRTGLGSRLERRILTPLDAFHRTRLEEPEEDELLFLHFFSASHIHGLLGNSAYETSGWHRHTRRSDQQDRRLRWYRESLRRHLRSNPGRQYLSKNPSFSWWVETLADAFPDARFVVMSRAPDHAINSCMAMHWTEWNLVSGLRPKGPEMQRLYQDSVRLYAHLEDTVQALPATRWTRVRYAALTQRPAKALSEVYSHFGWEDPPVEAWQGEAARARRRVPRRTPPLRSFGLTADQIRRDLADYPWLWEEL